MDSYLVKSFYLKRLYLCLDFILKSGKIIMNNVKNLTKFSLINNKGVGLYGFSYI